MYTFSAIFNQIVRGLVGGIEYIYYKLCLKEQIHMNIKK